MNPLIKELQNIEMSRAFGPTISLGGQYVQVERELARQKAASDSWKPPVRPDETPPVTTKSYFEQTEPMDWVEWMQFLMALGLFGPLFCCLVLLFPLAFMRLSTAEVQGVIGWASVIFWMGMLAYVAKTERARRLNKRSVGAS